MPYLGNKHQAERHRGAEYDEGRDADEKVVFTIW